LHCVFNSYASSVGAEHFCTSAKMNKGLDELFLHITKCKQEHLVNVVSISSALCSHRGVYRLTRRPDLTSMFCILLGRIAASVVTVAGICNSVGGGFFDTPPRCWCRWRILVRVKAWVVNWKQLDVVALRWFWLSWKALIARCTRRWGVHLVRPSRRSH